MSRILSQTCYLVVIPVIGLAVAAAVYFVFGGIGLIRLLIELTIEAISNLTQLTHGTHRGLVIFEVVEFVHLFLVGTALYITAIGLYRLFINEINFPNWLKINSTEELEEEKISQTISGGAGSVSTVSESRINTFMGQGHLLMSVSMIVTALVATWVTNSLNLRFALFSSPML